MPKLTGFFDQFPGIANLPVEQFTRWVNPVVKKTAFSNYLANRLLFSQTVATTLEELEFDLVILRQAIRLNPAFYYSESAKKITIPIGFLVNFPDLVKLAWAFVDALNPVNYATIWLKDHTLSVLGSVMVLDLTPNPTEIKVNIAGKLQTIKAGSLVNIPASDSLIMVEIMTKPNSTLGSNNPVLKLPGGKIGILLDARRKEEKIHE